VSRDYLGGLIAAGDKSALRDALDNPVFASFAGGLDDKGRSLLHDALDAGWEDMIAPLITAGAPPQAADENGNTPLHLAAMKGLTAAAEALLNAGVAIDARAHGSRLYGPTENEGDTPLHRAVEAGQAETVKLLLARGADPALTSPAGKNGMNAFHMAAAGESVPVLDLLLPHPAAAHMNDFCDHGKTRADAFRLALKTGYPPVVHRLIEHGIDVNRRDSEGHTPLHWLILHRNTRAEALPMIRLLLKNGADGDKATNLWGETPLMVAAKADFPEALQLLLDQGADATRRSNFLETALHFAAHHYTVETINLLLDAGADIDAPDRTGQTALHIAAHHNRRDVVKTLVGRGADPLLEDQRGRTPDRLCLSPVQTSTHHIILQAQKNRPQKRPTFKNGRSHGQALKNGRPQGPTLENGGLRGRFNTAANRSRRPQPRPFGKKPPSNGGGYRP